jgi:hypothetical protein
MISSANNSIARKVHELLLSAQPCSDDSNLIKAAQLRSKATKSAPNQLQDGTCLAVEKLRIAIKDGASAEESYCWMQSVTPRSGQRTTSPPCCHETL